MHSISIISIGRSFAERVTQTLKKRASSIFKRHPTSSKQTSNSGTNIPIPQTLFRDATTFTLPLPSSVQSIIGLSLEELLQRNSRLAAQGRASYNAGLDATTYTATITTTAHITADVPVKAVLPFKRDSALYTNNTASSVEIESTISDSDSDSDASTDWSDYSEYSSFYYDSDESDESEVHQPILRVHKVDDDLEVVRFRQPTSFYNAGFMRG